MARTKLADGSSNPLDKRAGRAVGRPGQLTPELTQEVVKWIKQDAMLGMLAALVGVYRVTFYDWLRRGERERQRRDTYEANLSHGIKPRREESAAHKRLIETEEIYLQFSVTVKSELEKRKMKHLKAIQSASTDRVKVKKVTRAVGLDEDEMGDGIAVTTEEVTEFGDWRAAAYLLEKGDPDQFGARATIGIKSLGFDPKDLENMDIEQLEQLKRQVLGDDPDTEEAAQWDTALAALPSS